ncbi:hypothetical protein RIF29_15871 [Crotalaria pallida]|uniref:Uncharacterized protein n=1 Tax=Crotalaria pallida TaxID=3830 RepID=A0AAN9FED2_CROPI
MSVSSWTNPKSFHLSFFFFIISVLSRPIISLLLLSLFSSQSFFLSLESLRFPSLPWKLKPTQNNKRKITLFFL